MLGLFHRNLPPNVSREILLQAIYQTPGFVDNIIYNKTDLKILQNVLTFNRYGVSETMALLQQPCGELFVKCSWEHNILPCNELFKPSLAYHGNCCTFNKNNDYS